MTTRGFFKIRKQLEIRIIIGLLVLIGVVYFAVFRNRKSAEIIGIPQPESAGTFHSSGPPSKDNVSSIYNEEVGQLEYSVQRNRNNFGHLKTLAHLLMDGHQMDKAIPYLEQAVRLSLETIHCCLIWLPAIFRTVSMAKRFQQQKRSFRTAGAGLKRFITRVLFLPRKGKLRKRRKHGCIWLPPHRAAKKHKRHRLILHSLKWNRLDCERSEGIPLLCYDTG